MSKRPQPVKQETVYRTFVQQPSQMNYFSGIENQIKSLSAEIGKVVKPQAIGQNTEVAKIKVDTPAQTVEETVEKLPKPVDGKGNPIPEKDPPIGFEEDFGTRILEWYKNKKNKTLKWQTASNFKGKSGSKMGNKFEKDDWLAYMKRNYKSESFSE